MDAGQRIRVITGSRHNDWQKGDMGTVKHVLVRRPANQTNIYIVDLDRGSRVWMTQEDLIPFNQLSIFDILPDEDQSPTPLESTDSRVL